MPKPKPLEPFDLMPSVDRTIDAMLLASVEPRAGMRALLAVGEALTPGPEWRKLSRLDWNEDLPRAKAWLTRVCKHPAAQSARGMWFGAPTIGWNSPLISACAYKQFRADDVECGWARERVFPDPKGAKPSPDEFESSCMARAAIALGIRYGWSEDQRVALGGELMDKHLLAFFIASLGYSCLLINYLFASGRPATLIGSASERGVSVGFAEGGHHQLGALTKHGWKSRPLCWVPGPDEHEEDAA